MHAHAVGGVQNDAPVAQLVLGAFDHQGGVAGNRADCLVLLLDIAQQVLPRPGVHPQGIESLPDGLGVVVAHSAGEGAQRFSELSGPTQPVTPPERQRSGLPERGRDQNPVEGDLFDPPAGGT